VPRGKFLLGACPRNTATAAAVKASATSAALPLGGRSRPWNAASFAFFNPCCFCHDDLLVDFGLVIRCETNIRRLSRAFKASMLIRGLVYKKYRILLISESIVSNQRSIDM
jgi:hypothetical protein